MFIIYNNFRTCNTPTEWEIFENSDEATEKMFSLGSDWDVTDLDSFKSWYPDINL